MDKKRAIQILTNSARLYKENLEDNKVLFLYGNPSEIKKLLGLPDKKMLHMEYYETAFHRYNFLHLTGVKISGSRLSSSIHFYEACLASRLREEDFSFSSDGSTIQKLDILEHMMNIKKNVTMIGDFTDRGPKLFTQKVAGGTCGCIGFVHDKNSDLNVPNTLLKKDIRDVTIMPTQKVYAVFYKRYQAEKYSDTSKLDKAIELHKCLFQNDIERMINREQLKLLPRSGK